MADLQLSLGQRAAKRSLDLALALPMLVLLSPVLVLSVLAATVDTGEFGIFRQTRIGRHGRPFTIWKLRTMRGVPRGGVGAAGVTVAGDPRITPLGALFRRLRLDEVPQLAHVVLGQMSLVGPRPDVPGFADTLEGRERALLQLRPGLTGPATLRYRNEAALLAQADDPVVWNREVLWPDKVRLNMAYLEQWRLRLDLHLLWRTMVGG